MPQKIKVGLVQINNSFSNQNYLPYSIGILLCYAGKFLKNKDRFEFSLPLYKRLPLDEGLRRLEGSDIVFFSVYVWNFRISAELAKALKQRRPGTLVIFGGPHVPDRSDDFMRKYPFIDVACHGEGEQVFAALLENFDAGNWDKVPSISFIGKDGEVVNHPKAERLKDIAVIPSPYLEGVFEPLMKTHPQEHWIALWETNRGCPFSCTFCDWGSATQSKVFQFDMERILKEVDWFARNRIEFVFCADANFGILPRDLDIAEYCARTKKKTGYPQALSVQNTKNATERAYMVQKILSDAGLNKGVVISLQSVNPGTLKDIKRANISTESYQELQRRFTRDRVETMSDLILCLPGETYDTFADGVKSVIENGQHNRIQFNNLSILPNAEMGDPEYQKKHGLVMVESKVVNIHGAKASSKDEIEETQVLVVGSGAMPKEDWVRTRAFCWMAALLHFDKIAQIPMILLREVCSLSYREMVEVFLESPLKEYPILNEIRNFFIDKARDIQNGGVEYRYSDEWLGIHWPADEYIFIKLSAENKLDAFYKELEGLLADAIKSRFVEIQADLLHEAVHLNRSLVKQPFQTADLDVELSYNLWEFYRSVLTGQKIPLENKKSRYHIDKTRQRWLSWDDWCREVVWYGNKKGAYLYDAGQSMETDISRLAGHT